MKGYCRLWEFSEQNTLEERKELARRMKRRQPGNVPVVLGRAARSRAFPDRDPGALLESTRLEVGVLVGVMASGPLNALVTYPSTLNHSSFNFARSRCQIIPIIISNILVVMEIK
ncbi:hypothetical protein E2C01_089541 [Portunus trituberculatus]|uniref:Uncharacterized protein n=1 Tax=Portunus trituberculatus TaxID=210409 RepID=A0A5B7JPV6_PORTR|nr:hypothetical protein [Portunus trituberculatus]